MATHAAGRPSMFALALACAAAATPLSAQAPRPLAVRSSVSPDAFIARDEPIRLDFDRALDPATERVAVFFGTTDVTPLFAPSGEGLRYSAGTIPLPSGETEVVVYHVTGTVWREVGRYPMKVVGRLDIETLRARPRLDLGLRGRLAYGQEPAAPAPDRPTYQMLDGQLGFESEVVRLGGGRYMTRTTVVGTSRRENRLRFRDKGPDAPAIDLSSYMVQAEQGPLRLAVGHVAAGSQRHLIDRFGSRGATVTWTDGARMDATFAALHGSNLVGWDDMLGITDPDHRLLNATLGLEALERPGALRVELSGLDGSVLPRAGFNRGAVTDAEQSRGVAVRVRASGLDQRLRLDAGLSRSAFDHPPDPLLNQGTELVPVEPATRVARYLDTSLDVVRGLRLGARRTARATLAFAHERVDPLFRTVAAIVRADHIQNRLELRGDVAGLTVGASHVRSHNNLENVPSVLTSHTRRSSADARMPVAAVLGLKPSGWWPHLRARLDRTHQFGAAVPAAGGFDASHVPDQVSDHRTLGADWRWRRASLGYQLDRSFQDNRQPGREKADLGSSSHALNLSANPVSALSLTLNAARSAARNHERDETDRTRRYGLGLSWRPLRQASLTVQLTDTRATNDGRGSTRDDRAFSAQWASPLPGLARVGGAWHLRYATSAHRSADATSNLDRRREDWFLDSGFSFRFF